MKHPIDIMIDLMPGPELRPIKPIHVAAAVILGLAWISLAIGALL